jgi:hypothetical protein
MNRRYQRLREQKRCTWCGEQDERTLQGYTLCQRCKKNLTRPDRAETKRISSRNYMNARYYKRQRNHQCTQCGADLANDYFYTACPKCRQKAAEYRRKKKTAGAGTPNGQ